MRILGLDELIPDTPAGKRATAERLAARREAGEASRAQSAATLEQRQRAYKPKAAATGWRKTNGAVSMNPATTSGRTAGSWWLGVPAEQFADRAASEQDRMQGSKFGRGKEAHVATEVDES